MSRCDRRSPPSAKRPNIILILSDDMGFSDLGCYGGEIDTPNLNDLAANGLRFTQFYNTARCCPTRASLLTGLYPHQAGVGHMMDDSGFPSYRGDLSRNCVTIAEVLRPAGYRTYMTGKWHVTRFAGKDGPKHNWPLQRGFERFYGTIAGARQLLRSRRRCAATTRSSRPQNDPEYKPESYYYTDAISDNAVQVHPRAPRDSRRTSRSSCTWPTRPPTGRCTPRRRHIAKYKGKYDEGYGLLPRGALRAA